MRIWTLTILTLQVSFRIVRPNPSANQNGMPVYSNMSKKEIFSVYQQYTGSQPSFINILGIFISQMIPGFMWSIFGGEQLAL